MYWECKRCYNKYFNYLVYSLYQSFVQGPGTQCHYMAEPRFEPPEFLPGISLKFTCWHIQFSSVQSLSCVRLFVTPWIAARKASLSITNSQSSHRLISIESVMPSSHFILCRPLFLLPPILPSITVFSNESTLHMRWPKY